MANLYPDTTISYDNKIQKVSQMLHNGFAANAIASLIESGAARIINEGSSASGAAVGSVADHLAANTGGRTEPSPAGTANSGA